MCGKKKELGAKYIYIKHVYESCIKAKHFAMHEPELHFFFFSIKDTSGTITEI